MDDGKIVAGFFEPHEAEEIRMLDRLVGEYHKKLTLDGWYMPLNFHTERNIFVEQKGSYLPVFSYKAFPLARGRERYADIQRILIEVQKKSWISACFPLYLEKIYELCTQLEILIAWEERRYEDMQRGFSALFPTVDHGSWNICERDVNRYFQKHTNVGTYEDGSFPNQTLRTGRERKTYTQEILQKLGLTDVPVVLREHGSGARCYVQYTPETKLILHVSDKISSVRAQAASAHEISHLRRWQAGRQQGLQLLQRGTAGVLPQEEGGALAAAMQHWQQAGKNREGLLPSQLLLCATVAAEKLGFLEVCAYLRTLSEGRLGAEKVFTLAARAKRGVRDMSRAGDYPKGSLYRLGYQEVLSLRGELLDDSLFYTYGKVKRSDIALLELVV